MVFKNSNLRCKDILKSITPSISYWIQRLGRWGFDFEATSKGDLLIRCGDVNIAIDGYDVCLIVEEVFGNLQYGVLEDVPSIVIDVGLNVGVAALYFASQAWCERVVGFEPLTSTFCRAQRNIGLNPILARKITVHNYGLGDRNCKVRAVVVPGNSGLTSTVPLGVETKTGFPNHVSIRNAKEILEFLITEAGDRNVHLKVDCEGGEAQIFEALPGSILERLNTIMLEWHSQSILLAIASKLAANGFSLFSQRTNLQTGLLCASLH